MTRAPFKMFGKTRMVKVVTYSPPNSEPHNPPKAQWDKEMWIERGEDWYGFLDTALAGKIIRVVTPDDWAEAGP